MDRNFKLTIEYDGTHYHGWQVQPNGPSIQQVIESRLERMTRQKIRLLGSGRTDAGVHALGQVANFSCKTQISPFDFQKGLNSMLPNDIVIHECVEVDPSFHARYDARSKCYRYRILNRSIPPAIGRQYIWWIRSALDLPTMQQAANQLIGRHDFKAFEGAGSPRSHTVRHVMQASFLNESSNAIEFKIEADGFLRYMVRNIVGTLVAVGRGNLTPKQFEAVMASRDRNQAAATAPPQGLCLMCVNYAEDGTA